MKYDVIIVGAGLGGLVAGAKLSKEGKKVLVIEQHSKPGGCATTFKRGDFTLEVGLHEMDSPAPGEMKSRIFTDLDVFNNVEFLKVPEFYHFDNNRYRVTISHDPAEASKILISMFPEDTDGINKWFRLLLTPRKKNQPDEQSGDISVGDYLDSIIRDEDLKLILMGNLGYFHDDPYLLSLAYYAPAQGSYFSNGGSFIKGGSQKLSNHFADYIKSHGGEVILKHLVTRLHISGDNVDGVVYRNKNTPESGEIIAQADQVILNASVPEVKNLLPEKFAAELENDISGEVKGPSLLTVYFGFGKNLKDLGYKYYSAFIYDESVKSLKDIPVNNRADYSRRSFTFVDYGQLDSGLARSGKSVGAICCIDYLNDWEKMNKDEYKVKKEMVSRIFTARLNKIIPGVKDVIEYCEVGTPVTVKRYTLNAAGATHGFVNTPSRKPAAILKSLNNLHYASAWGKTGGGFSGAIYGGYLTALSLIRKKTPVPEK